MKATKKPILPELMRVVAENGEIHYDDATRLLIKAGVWKRVPATPSRTVSAYLTTRTDANGNKLFRATGHGYYKVHGGKPAYQRFLKTLA